MKEAFEVWEDNIEKLVFTHPLQLISFEATRKCNMNCLHCGSPSETVNLGKELKTKEVIAAFRQIAKDFDLLKFHHINITGGEPFVRKDLTKILREISKIKEFRNIAIQTNGLYIANNPEILDEIKNYGVTGIGVSIDGLKNTHDFFRSKKGAWEKSIKAAKLAVKKGFVVTISVTAHSKNVNEIPKLYHIIKKFHPRFFRVMTIDSIGRANINNNYLLSPTQIKKVINFIKKEYSKNFKNYADKKTTILELGCGGWLSTKLEGRIRPYIFHCIAGLNNLGILYDGKIASCSNISRDFIEGDLRKDRIKEVWDKKFERFRNFEWKKINDCKICKEWKYCHGGPMHKRLKDGNMIDCLYQTITNKTDYRNTSATKKAFMITAGN